MKIIFSTLILLLACNLMANPVREELAKVDVALPAIYGKPIHGGIVLVHDENFGRVRETEVYRKIDEFIYTENNRDVDSFDPENGEGVIIAKERLGGFLDTDLLKVKFGKQYFDGQLLRDTYPVTLKFRASIVNRIFKKIDLMVVRPINNTNWQILYLSKEVDRLEIALNALGKVIRLNLYYKNTLVTQLNLDQISSIPESEF